MEVTELKNKLKDKEVQVREGNAGVTRLVTTLKPGASTTIRSHPNAAYKEYIMMTLPANTTLPVLSSNDFADDKEIDIVEEDGRVVWKGTSLRRPGLFRRVLSRSLTLSLTVIVYSVFYLLDSCGAESGTI